MKYRQSRHTAATSNALFAAIRARWNDLPRTARIAIPTSLTLLLLVGIFTFRGSEPPPRERQYLTFKSCLLTDPQGIQHSNSSAAWKGMQEASLETRARVQFFSITGPKTVANSLPFLTSLVRQQCDVIIAVDELAVRTVLAGADLHKEVRFVIAGTSDGHPNVTRLTVSTPKLPEAIKSEVTKALGRSK